MNSIHFIQALENKAKTFIPLVETTQSQNLLTIGLKMWNQIPLTLKNMKYLKF